MDRITHTQKVGHSLVETFLHFSNQSTPSQELQIASGGWQIKLAPNILKTALSASILTTALFSSGATQLSSLVLPAIVALLFDIEKIELSAKENHLLAELRLNPEVKHSIQTPKRLYAALEDSIREQVAYLDFLDFVEKLHLTGNTYSRGPGAFEISPNSRLRISFV